MLACKQQMPAESACHISDIHHRTEGNGRAIMLWHFSLARREIRRQMILRVFQGSVMSRIAPE